MLPPRSARARRPHLAHQYRRRMFQARFAMRRLDVSCAAVRQRRFPRTRHANIAAAVVTVQRAAIRSTVTSPLRDARQLALDSTGIDDAIGVDDPGHAESALSPESRRTARPVPSESRSRRASLERRADQDAPRFASERAATLNRTVYSKVSAVPPPKSPSMTIDGAAFEPQARFP